MLGRRSKRKGNAEGVGLMSHGGRDPMKRRMIDRRSNSCRVIEPIRAFTRRRPIRLTNAGLDDCHPVRMAGKAQRSAKDN